MNMKTRKMIMTATVSVLGFTFASNATLAAPFGLTGQSALFQHSIEGAGGTTLLHLAQVKPKANAGAAANRQVDRDIDVDRDVDVDVDVDDDDNDVARGFVAGAVVGSAVANSNSQSSDDGNTCPDENGDGVCDDAATE